MKTARRAVTNLSRRVSTDKKSVTQVLLLITFLL
jgi:hypothetical protein